MGSVLFRISSSNLEEGMEGISSSGEVAALTWPWALVGSEPRHHLCAQATTRASTVCGGVSTTWTYSQGGGRDCSLSLVLVRSCLDTTSSLGSQNRRHTRKSEELQGRVTILVTDGGAGTLALQEASAQGMVHLGGGMVLGASNCILCTVRRRRRRCSQALHSGAWQKGKGQQHR